MMRRARIGSLTNEDVQKLLGRFITVLDKKGKAIEIMMENNIFLEELQDKKVPSGATIEHSAQYYFNLSKKDRKVMTFCPKNAQSNMFNDEVTKLCLEESKEKLEFIESENKNTKM